jgi:O-antigen ligase
MLNPLLTYRLKTLVVSVVCLLLAVILGWQVGNGDYIFLALECATILVVVAAFFLGGFFWVLAIASSFLSGTFPILQGQFTPFHIFVAVGVIKFLIADVVLQRTKVTMGSRFDAVMITAFMSILLWHGFHDRFGMRFLGSDIWGGKFYVNVFVGMASFCVIQSIPIKPKLWAKLPYVVLGVAAFDLLITVITTIFPSLIFVVYPFYSAVSTAGVIEALSGNAVDTARLYAFGNFGFILIVVILASTSIRKIFTISNLFRLLLLLGAGLSVLYSSFRTSVFNSAIAALVAGIRDLRWAVVAILPLLAAFLLGLSFVNSELVSLPKQFQRSLAFLPGKWDAEMAKDVTASNDFRRDVWTLWLQQYFPAHPWFGRGFGFRSDWARNYSPIVATPDANQQMVETGNIHNGFFSALDAFGIVGTIFFVVWNIRLFWLTFQVPHPGRETGVLTYRFLGLYLATFIFCFWGGAPNIGGVLPQEFALAAVFLRLQREFAAKTVLVRPRESSIASPASERLAHA